MDIITSTALRENLSKILDQVCDSAAPLIVTRQNARSVVIMSLDEFNAIEETMHLMSSPANNERLLQSIANADAGNLIQHDIVEINDEHSKSAA